jgi:hypothetical protein
VLGGLSPVNPTQKIHEKMFQKSISVGPHILQYEIICLCSENKVCQIIAIWHQNGITSPPYAYLAHSFRVYMWILSWADFRGANCSSVVLELRWSSLTLPRQKCGSGKELLRILQPRWSNLLRWKSCSWEKSSTEAHPDERHFFTNFKLKINVTCKYFFELQIYSTKPTSWDYPFKSFQARLALNGSKAAIKNANKCFSLWTFLIWFLKLRCCVSSIRRYNTKYN